MTPTSLDAARETFQKISANISKIMRGQAGPTRQLLAALATGGHVLLEDFPGTGKTTLAKALAKSIDALEPRVNGFGKRLGERGLARAGKIFQQHMAAGGERGEQLARRPGLAAHDFGDVGGNFLERFARGVEAGRCHGRLYRDSLQDT